MYWVAVNRGSIGFAVRLPSNEDGSVGGGACLFPVRPTVPLSVLLSKPNVFWEVSETISRKILSETGAASASSGSSRRRTTIEQESGSPTAAPASASLQGEAPAAKNGPEKRFYVFSSIDSRKRGKAVTFLELVKLMREENHTVSNSVIMEKWATLRPLIAEEIFTNDALDPDGSAENRKNLVRKIVGVAAEMVKNSDGFPTYAKNDVVSTKPPSSSTAERPSFWSWWSDRWTSRYTMYGETLAPLEWNLMKGNPFAKSTQSWPAAREMLLQKIDGKAADISRDQEDLAELTTTVGNLKALVSGTLKKIAGRRDRTEPEQWFGG